MKLRAAMLVSVAVGAAAGTPPPPEPFPAVGWKATAAAKPSTGITMGSFVIEWDNTTLDAVLGAARLGSIQHEGDAGNSVYWLCYTAEGANGYRLWVVSQGEMGGTGRAVTGATAEALKDARGGKDCPALPTTLQPVALSQGLWLGASEAKAREVLGEPSHSEGPWRAFDYSSKVPGACDGGFDLTNRLWYKLADGRLTTIITNQVTTC